MSVAAPDTAQASVPSMAERQDRPRVVILGAGFGGLNAAQALASVPVGVTIVDSHNYHLFQPLLYQVATAGLSPAQIAVPIRSILKRQANATVRLARVTGIDKEARQVLLGEERLGYDWLIIATGARHAYFGHDEWERYAPGLKRVEDATAIRRHILVVFEQAENAAVSGGTLPPLNFVVIGGGPTGVEMAGAIAELARMALASDFRHIDPRRARIILIEAGPRLLPAFPESLARFAQGALERLGVEVRLGAAVTDCRAEGVMVGEELIESHCAIWAAGVAASPAAQWLGVERDRAGRVRVNADLTLPGRPEIFVIGDTALVIGADGKQVPGVAPAAKQEGAYAAWAIRRKVAGDPVDRPFRYHDLGNLATIGRRAAIADFGWVRFRGRLAWLLWGVVHIAFLVGFSNRLTVLVEWLWAYFTFQRGARLITNS